MLLHWFLLTHQPWFLQLRQKSIFLALIRKLRRLTSGAGTWGQTVPKTARASVLCNAKLKQWPKQQSPAVSMIICCWDTAYKMPYLKKKKKSNAEEENCLMQAWRRHNPTFLGYVLVLLKNKPQSTPRLKGDGRALQLLVVHVVHHLSDEFSGRNQPSWDGMEETPEL